MLNSQKYNGAIYLLSRTLKLIFELIGKKKNNKRTHPQNKLRVHVHDSSIVGGEESELAEWGLLA